MDEFITTNLKKVLVFRRTLSKETDRGCTLMAASFLENELENLIKLKFIGTKSQIDKLFSFNGPIGTFSSKIKISYATGLINESIARDLELIRKIRNEFGHNYEPIDFTDPTLNDKITKLRYHFFENTTATARQVFINTVSGVLGRIHGASVRVEKFRARENFEESEESKKQTREHAEKIARTVVEKLIKEDNYLDSSDKATKIMFEELINAFTFPSESVEKGN